MARLVLGGRRLGVDWIGPARPYSSAGATKSMKLALLGVNCHTGRSLALSLKQSSLIDELAVYDAKPAAGLLLELSHMSTGCRTARASEKDDASGDEGLRRALHRAKVVAIVSETRDTRSDARDLEKYVPAILRHCPKALVAVIGRSVNSMLPMMVEMYKQVGEYDWSRLFGCASLMSVRANGLAARALGVDPEFVGVPIIGGASPDTCVPVFTQTRPCANFSPEELSKLTLGMRNAESTLEDAYRTSPSQPSGLCSGYAAARFCVSLCKALRGEPEVVECAYVRSCLVPGLSYLVSPLKLGPGGVERQLGIPGLAANECDALGAALPKIREAIALGEKLVQGRKGPEELCPTAQRCTAVVPCGQPVPA